MLITLYTFDIPKRRRPYKTENTSVQAFIDQCCEPLNPETATKYQTTGKMWKVFKRWCDEGKFHVPTKGEFRKELSQTMGLRVDRVVEHTRDGGFYLFVVKEEFVRKNLPRKLPAIS